MTYRTCLYCRGAMVALSLPQWYACLWCEPKIVLSPMRWQHRWRVTRVRDGETIAQTLEHAA